MIIARNNTQLMYSDKSQLEPVITTTGGYKEIFFPVCSSFKVLSDHWKINLRVRTPNVLDSKCFHCKYLNTRCMTQNQKRHKTTILIKQTSKKYAWKYSIDFCRYVAKYASLVTFANLKRSSTHVRQTSTLKLFWKFRQLSNTYLYN